MGGMRGVDVMPGARGLMYNVGCIILWVNNMG